MLRLGTFLCVISLMTFSPSRVEAEPALCPEGFVCIPAATYSNVKLALQKLAVLETTQPEFTMDPVFIIVDRQGRYFSNGTGAEPANGVMRWGAFEAKLAWVPEIRVSQRVDPTWGWRLRVKAALWFNILEASASAIDRPLDAGLLLEPFYIQWFNVQVFAGLKSFGVGLGADLTANFGVLVGGACSYGLALTPNLGLYFSFN